MAGSLLLLLDDIATMLDDVALLTKVAAQKTAGVLGDDLALNAQQVAGLNADRELPVVWAVFKGSLLNKGILVPGALVLSAVAPWVITPLLMVGGIFLCFEGFEKIAHQWLHSSAENADEHARLLTAVGDEKIDLVAFEKDKIKGAVRTDFILSTEIIVITLGTVASSSLVTQVGVLSAVAVAMTLGVYGLVAVIVKIDDLGLFLTRREAGFANALQRKLGHGLVSVAPMLLKALTVLGTLAMFLVGGGILVHGWHGLSQTIELLSASVSGLLQPLLSLILNLLAGVVAGGAALAVERMIRHYFLKRWH
jgi:predicted DNA repair protein MutK